DQYIFWTDGPAWSLAVEFHFYVLMALAVPLVNGAVRRRSTRRGRLAVASVLPALSIAVGLGFLAWATLTGQALENWSVWFSPLSRGVDFGLGMGLAVASAAGVRFHGRLRLATALLGTVALVALVMARPDTVAGQWWHPLYAAAIALGMTSIVLHDGPWPRVLDWRPLARVGALGYGVYLLHEPVMRFLGHLGLLPEARPGPQFLITALLVVVPTIALAWLSARTLETAGLRLLAMTDRDGRPRDYYEHLGEEDLSPTVRTRSPAPAAAPREPRPA
ncbi:MAG: Acyltransferase 3, partial [Nocardioides sp.]|nr:Acyltransferase 3 [Nocardioides sp.]